MSGTLITGGAGSLGREITRQLIAENVHQRIVIYSRDEGKQQAMREEIPEGGPDGVRYMLGDICDTDRLTAAMKYCDRVIHCAALKMIDTCEYDVYEATRINVMGTLSVAKACTRSHIPRAIYVSTDKAVDPVSTYGFTKGLAEDIWIHSNLHSDTCSFMATRYGNVISSAKSVFHQWEKLRMEGKPIPVTHPDVTRYYWTLSNAANFVLKRLEDGSRGIIYAPSMRSYLIHDIAKLYGTPTITGWRCPEKIHEILWTDHETSYTTEVGDYYAVYPESHPWGDCPMIGTPVTTTCSSKNHISDFKKDFIDGHTP